MTLPNSTPTITRIFIDDLRVQAVIGIYDHEQAGPQELRIDAELRFDASAPGATDDIGQTIDYGAIVALIEAACLANTHQLLEALSAHLLDELFARFPLIGADLKIGKTGIFDNVGNIGIRSLRGQMS